MFGERVPGVQVQLFGQSTLILLGANTYTGSTTITDGCGCATLQLGDASHVASIVGDVINGGSFAIVNADTSRINSITTDGGFTGFLGSNTAIPAKADAARNDLFDPHWSVWGSA